MEEIKYEIWCKSNDKIFWCKTIYQKWGEEIIPFKRRAKRVFKKYVEENQNENRKFYLIKDCE